MRRVHLGCGALVRLAVRESEPRRVTGCGVALEMVYEFLRTPFDEANRENVRRIKAAENL